MRVNGKKSMKVISGRTVSQFVKRQNDCLLIIDFMLKNSLFRQTLNVLINVFYQMTIRGQLNRFMGSIIRKCIR